MAINDNGKNAALDALAALITHIGLHSADPGASGANEIAGGSPAYARQAVAWGSAAAGVVAMTGTETFDVQGGDTVAFVGLWSASGAGTCYGGADVTDEVFGAQGTYEVLTLTITASDPA